MNNQTEGFLQVKQKIEKYYDYEIIDIAVNLIINGKSLLKDNSWQMLSLEKDILNPKESLKIDFESVGIIPICKNQDDFLCYYCKDDQFYICISAPFGDDVQENTKNLYVMKVAIADYFNMENL
ncbi:MAG: hypothetical protein E7378_03440 [Clostridiales bacterium]|nr:hypothetical protein [Clostridiales bacterium]